MLLIYATALARSVEHTFAHAERMLVILSGGACLIILASPGKLPVLPLVSSSLQRIIEYGNRVYC